MDEIIEEINENNRENLECTPGLAIHSTLEQSKKEPFAL